MRKRDPGAAASARDAHPAADAAPTDDPYDAAVHDLALASATGSSTR
ncbi:MAG: hypothetical protein ACLP81_02410 [Acidimicrobiales bacterium]